MAISPLTFHFSPGATKLLVQMGEEAYRQGIGWLWVRLTASRTHLKNHAIRYLVETEVDPIASTLVLSEDHTGIPLVSVSWDHPSPIDWQVTNVGTPSNGLEFHRFSATELRSIFGLITSFDRLEVAA